jgi:hypothetical protein
MAMATLEQGDAEPSFKVFDATAESGLGDGTTVRCFTEMTSFG